MRRRPILALFVVLAAVLVFAWRSSLSTPSSRDLDNPAPEIAATLPSSPEPAIEAPLSDREEVKLPGMPPQAAPPDEAIEDRVQGTVESPEWDKHYAGWTTARLEARLNELEPRYLAELDRLYELRFAAGQYRVIPASELEGEDG